jgi:hypothetical protein
MKSKVGFSVITSIDRPIVLVDEVLSVGDRAFRQKCFDRMEDMIKRQGKTVLLVSHNVRQVERLCSRVILLDHGAVVSDGNSTEVCNLFVDQSNEKIQSNQKINQARVSSDEVEFGGIEVVDGEGTRTDSVEFLQPMRVRLTFTARTPLRQITFYIGLHTTDFVYLTAHNTAYEPVDFEKGVHCVELEIKAMTLLPRVYCVAAWIGPPNGERSSRVRTSEFSGVAPSYGYAPGDRRSSIWTKWNLDLTRLHANAGTAAAASNSSENTRTKS